MSQTAFPLHRAIDLHPPIVSKETDVVTALAIMQTQATSYVLIATEQKTLVGLFTERDFVHLIAQKLPLDQLHLVDILAPEVVSLQQDDLRDLLQVLGFMHQHGVRHLPIVTDQNTIIGTITQESIRELIKPVDLLRLRRVHEVMVRDVICASPDTSILALTQLMDTCQVSCVVITETNAQGQKLPLGIVTERDITRLCSPGQQCQTWLARTVMSAPLFPISSHEILWNAHAVMQRHRVRRLVVVDADGVLEGIVTQTTLLQMLDPIEAHITVETLQNIIQERTVSLDKANKALHKKVVERKRAKIALQKQIARERLLNRLSQKIRCSLQVDEILTTTVVEARQFLKADRAFVYQFNPSGSGEVAVEAVGEDYVALQGRCDLELVLSQLKPDFYQKGRIHSIPDLELLNLPPQEITLLRCLQIRSSLVAPILERDNLWGLLIFNQCSGPRRWEKLEIDLIKQLATQVGIALQQAHLYEQLESANNRLKHLADSDGLTQLANRRRFDEAFQLEFFRAAREQQPLSLILCDVDYFKFFNDTYGHQAGDDCLQQVARALQTAIKRATDLVARYGGEEFVVILPNTPLTGAMRVAQIMQAAVRALAIAHGKSQVSPWVTLSLGIAATIPQPGQATETLLAAADEALYQAKAEGRDRICTRLLSDDRHH